eukprot:403356442
MQSTSPTVALPEGFKQEENILYGVTKEGVFHIKINNPKRKNPMTRKMYAKMTQILRKANSDNNAKVVLVYGAGGNFSSGFNVMEANFDDISNETPEQRVQFMVDYTMAFATLEKPLYYLVQGCCVGIMATGVAHADFAFASEDAYFMTPFISMTLCPEDASSLNFLRVFGRKKTSELLFGDHKITAQEALSHGHLNAILKADQIPSTDPIITDYSKLPFLAKLLQGNQSSIRQTKKLLIHALEPERIRDQVRREFQFIEARKEDPDFYQSMLLFKNQIKAKGKKAENPKL